MRFAFLAALLLAACASPVPAPSPSPKTSPTTTASAAPTASPTAVSCANVPPVYHPARLKLLDACVEFKGIVLAVIHEKYDGDYHLWISPDPGFEKLLNAANVYNGRPALVVEIVPACTSVPSSAAAASRCPTETVYDPAKLVQLGGAHVYVVGPHVSDNDHGNWNEIHPADKLVVLAALSDPAGD